MTRDQYHACRFARGSILRALDEVPLEIKPVVTTLRQALAELDQRILVHELDDGESRSARPSKEQILTAIKQTSTRALRSLRNG